MIDASLSAVLRSQYAIRRFFIMFIILEILLLLLLLVIESYASGIFKIITINTLTAALSTIFVLLITYAFYVYITPKGLRNAQLIPIHSAEIYESIFDLRTDTNEYWFWGRSGTYFRASVLKELDDSSRMRRSHVTINLLLPEINDENSRQYRQIKRGLGEEADLRTLPASIVATIADTVKRVSLNPYLNARIALCSNVPSLRYDISTAAALITRDARHLPAILCNSGNPYYEMFRDAVLNEMNQSKPVSWDADNISENAELSLDDLLEQIVGIEDIESEVISVAKGYMDDPKHRYER